MATNQSRTSVSVCVARTRSAAGRGDCGRLGGRSNCRALSPRTQSPPERSDAAVAAEEEDVGVSGREENGKVRRGLCGFGVGRRADHPIQSLVLFF